MQFLHPVHRAHPTAPHAAQVGRTRGVLPFQRGERAAQHQVAPDLVEVHVMHVPEHRGDLRAGRPGTDLGHRDRPVRPAEPLHVRQRVPYPERPQRRRTDLPDPVVARIVHLPRQQHGPLDPRGAQHLQRRRQVVRHRREHRVAADRDAVERVFLADEELLQQAGRVGARRDRVEPGAQRTDVVQAVRRQRTGTGRRLRDERETDRLGEPQRLVRAGHQLVTRARYPRLPQHRLHPRLVADVAGGLHVHPFDAQRLADLRQRHLKLFQRADEPLHPAHLAAEPGDRLGDLPRVERVVDPPVPVEVLLEHRRQLLSRGRGDDGQPDTGHPGRGRDEARGGFQQERGDECSNDHRKTVPPPASMSM